MEAMLPLLVQGTPWRLTGCQQPLHGWATEAPRRPCDPPRVADRVWFWKKKSPSSSVVFSQPFRLCCCLSLAVDDDRAPSAAIAPSAWRPAALRHCDGSPTQAPWAPSPRSTRRTRGASSASVGWVPASTGRPWLSTTRARLLSTRTALTEMAESGCDSSNAGLCKHASSFSFGMEVRSRARSQLGVTVLSMLEFGHSVHTASLHMHVFLAAGAGGRPCPLPSVCLLRRERADTKDQVADALKRFEVLFFAEDNEQVRTSRAWQFVGPSICFCIFVWSM